MAIHWKVLVIDDDAGIRRVTAIALEDAGYAVHTAPDGETGVRLFVEEHPQLVITDVGMPGIDGLEVLRRIKEIDPEAEVIVATAFSDIALAIKAMQFDAAGFVTKPVSNDTLALTLNRARDRYARRKDMRDYATLMEEKWLETMEELARTFHFQKLLIDSSMDGIVACDRQDKVIIFNRSMEEMLGCLRERIIGKATLLQFFAPGQAQVFKERLLSEEWGGRYSLFPFETELVREDGSRIPVLVSARVLFQEQERMGIVVFFRDRTNAGRPG